MKRDGDMMSSIPKIKSSGIIVDYDGKRALHGIDLDIYPNEVSTDWPLGLWKINISALHQPYE